MTTQIIQAFQKAGVKMTKSERIWRYLKDKPGRTLKQIEAELHMQSINAPIHYMKKAGLLRVEQQQQQNNRKVNLHFARGNEFSNEGLYIRPLKRAVIAPKVVPNLEQVVPNLEQVPQIPQAPTTLNLDNLTIAEARNLYLQLKKMFA